MLTLKDIHFCYQKPIFKNTTMELPSTSFACIQGKSGSGKTTLLKLLIFDLKLDSGEIPVSYTHLDVYKRQLFKMS